ncbi:MAG: hypothetical protein C5B50_12785 [Verrucomicrobia bacterium]|nr:MAG: hypothetical protein C5B50_12785 [Verrucomicrobiota bacterium]
MCTPEQFRSRWESKVLAAAADADHLRLRTVPEASVSSTKLPPTSRRFLIEAGLPEQCAPLGFEEMRKGLRRIWEVYSPGQWKREEKAGVEHYLVLGLDENDNPICADERDGKVVMLDHELLFDQKRREKRIRFVNSGIPQLAECLLALETVEPEARLEAIRQIDPPAAQEKAFLVVRSQSRFGTAKGEAMVRYFFSARGSRPLSRKIDVPCRLPSLHLDSVIIRPHNS